jgi:peptidyl-prolyl cis-trans isomerase C
MLGMLAGMAMLVFVASEAEAQTPAAPAKAAAVVNGEPISTAEVDAVLKLMPPTQTPSSEAQLRQMRGEALEMLIDDVLMRQFLNQRTAQVEPAKIAKVLGDLETSLQAQHHTLQDFLRDTAQTEAHLRSDIVKKLQWEVYVAGQLTDADIQRYYEQNKDYYDQVTVQASHILLRVPPRASEAEKEAARAKLADLRHKLVAGQLDFAEAAKKYSQCASAEKGGDLGFFPRKWAIDENIARAAFALKVGEISDVVQTDFGFHLIKVTNRRPGTPSSFEHIKREVRENCAAEMMQTILQQQRKVARIDTFMP